MERGDLRKLSPEEFEQLAVLMESEHRRRDKKVFKDVLDKARALAARAGYRIELLPLEGESETEALEPESPKQTKLPPGIYQNPDDPNLTYRSGGRGRQPRWLREAVEAGIDVSEWMVEEEEEETETAA